MRKAAIIILIISSFLFSGCTSPMLKEPKELIKPPRLSSGQEKIKKFLSEKIPKGCVLSSPVDMDKLAAINFADINSDGVDEIIAFYKYREHFRYGMIIIGKEDGKLKKITDVEASAKGISYVSFMDMDCDGLSEIQIGWSADTGSKASKELSIYRFEGSRLEKVFSENYSKLVIEDLDEDRFFEVVLLKFKDEYISEKALAQLYKYQNKSVFKMDELEMDSAEYIGKYCFAKSGKAFEDRMGIFVDFTRSSDSFATEILTLSGSRLQNVFKNEYPDKKYMSFNERYEKTSKRYNIESKDVDGDGIIEIGRFVRPFGHEDSPMLSIPWIRGWYKWDGQESLVLSRQSYANLNEGYELLFPERWNGKITLDRSDYGEDLPWIKISYFDERSQKKYPLYTIHVIAEEHYEKIRESKKNDEFMELTKRRGRVYIMEMDCKKTKVPAGMEIEFGSLIMTRDEILDNFKLTE